jgi:hypothetical protein
VRCFRNNVLEDGPERRNVPLSVAKVEKHSAFRLPWLHSESLVKGAARGNDAQVSVEHDKRLPDGVDDSLRQTMPSRNDGQRIVVRHAVLSPLRPGFYQRDDGARQSLVAEPSIDMTGKLWGKGSIRRKFALARCGPASRRSQAAVAGGGDRPVQSSAEIGWASLRSTHPTGGVSHRPADGFQSCGSAQLAAFHQLGSDVLDGRSTQLARARSQGSAE